MRYERWKWRHSLPWPFTLVSLWCLRRPIWALLRSETMKAFSSPASWRQRKYTTPSPIALNNIYPQLEFHKYRSSSAEQWAADKAELPEAPPPDEALLRWASYANLQTNRVLSSQCGKISNAAIKSSGAVEKHLAVYLSFWWVHVLLKWNVKPS